jgi:hypothetical protein
MSLSEEAFVVALEQFEQAESEQPDCDGPRFLFIPAKLRALLLGRGPRYAAKRKWQRGSKWR